MTVSLHKSAMYAKMLVGALALSLSSVPLSAQDAAEDQTEPAEQNIQAAANQETAEASRENATANTRRKERYYLGERLRLQRQQGPAIGKPTNILPQPFVPKGSVVVPPAPVAEQDALVGDPLLADSLAIESPDENHAEIDTADVLEPILQREDSSGIEAVVSEFEDIETTFNDDEQFLVAGALELLDPSGLSVFDDAPSYPLSFWDGYSRAEVAAGYGKFGGAVGSRALAQIANKIATSGVTLPEPEDDADILEIVQARLALLASLGNQRGYISLLERLPGERDWSALVKDFSNRHLLRGELGDVCLLAAAQRETDDDSYWLRMAAFCEAARGNRNGVDFQLSVLEEVAEVQPTFYQLIDQIVVEAEQAPGSVVPVAAELSNSLKVDLLEATMARLARSKVPLLELDGVNPLAVQAMIALPGVEREAKIDLMGLAIRRGWVNAQGLAAFFLNHVIQPGEQEAALTANSSDNRFVIDAALGHLASRIEAGEMRTNALQSLWARSVRQRSTSIVAGGYNRITEDLIPNSDVGVVGGSLARAALIDGNIARAVDWYRALRAEAVGNPQVDRGLISLTPLFVVAGADGAPVMTPNHLQLWWNGEGAREDRFSRANLLFTVMEALGNSVPDESWRWLEEGPAVFEGGTPSAAIWRRFLIAVQQHDAPRALIETFSLVSEGGPATVSASLGGSLIGGLMALGLEEEARLIAVEMLISQGL